MDQAKVAEELANYFSTVADNIGGSNVTSLEEHDFEDHPSVHNIKQNNESDLDFNFNFKYPSI